MQSLLECIGKLARHCSRDRKWKLWGSKYLEQVSRDLTAAFPGMRGFSTTNLKRMRIYASEYLTFEVGAQPVHQLPWGSIIDLNHKVKDISVRNWYAQEAVKQGWSRNVLNIMIKSDLYARQADAPKMNNFKETLPALQSDMAHELFKDPYNFEFLHIGKDAKEREIEQALVYHIRDFLLRLGQGFSFVGSQYKVEVGGDEFFIDMLFFNITLNCYVVVELKTGKYHPADSGQLNFYVTVVDEQIKAAHHAPTIGILLCETKNEVVAEYSLKKVDSPIGISQYELDEALTQHLKMVRVKNQLAAGESEAVV